MAFYEWLIKFKEVDLAIGDLAEDVYRDSSFPKDSSDYDELAFHLEDNGACYDAIKTLEKSFEFYKNSMKEEQLHEN